MAVLDTLVVKVVGDASQFAKTMRQGRDELGRFSNKTETLSSKMGRYAKSVGLAAAKTGTLAALAGAGWGVKLAAEAETAAVAFETLTGNADTAKTLMDNLRTLSASTPLSSREVRDAGRMLLAFGESAESIPGTLRRIGDVASLTGNRIGDLAEIYGKARVQGTLFAEDINQLTGRGIPVLQEFASQLGVGADQVKKLGSEGKITFKNLETAFFNMTSEGGKFADGMAKQAETLAGKWSTFVDTVGGLAKSFGELLVPALKQVVEWATAATQALSDMFLSGTDPGRIQRKIDLATRRPVLGLATLAQDARYLEARRQDVRGRLGIENIERGHAIGQALADALPGMFAQAQEGVQSFRTRNRMQRNREQQEASRERERERQRVAAEEKFRRDFGLEGGRESLLGRIGRGINEGLAGGFTSVAAAGRVGAFSIERIRKRLADEQARTPRGISSAALKGTAEAARLDAMDRAAADRDAERNDLLGEIKNELGNIKDVVARGGLGALGL